MKLKPFEVSDIIVHSLGTKVVIVKVLPCDKRIPHNSCTECPRCLHPFMYKGYNIETFVLIETTRHCYNSLYLSGEENDKDGI